MAGDGLTVRIDDDLAEELRAAAAARGMPVEAYVRETLASRLLADIEWSDDPDPAIDDAIAEETLRLGDGIPWEVFQERLKAFGRRPA
jgi:plasmid stability protein